MPKKKSDALIPLHLFFPKQRWFYLFHLLLVLLFITPYVEGSSSKKPYLLVLMNSILTLTIVYSVSQNRKQFFTALILGSVEILYMSYPALPYSVICSLLATACLYLFTILLILAHLFQSPRVTIAEIYGAISLYILIGMSWSVFYQLLEGFAPGSIIGGGEGSLSGFDFLFFSFTTLTTLGYGDIVPLSAPARSLAILEALTGVVFLGVLVSRSIGLYLAEIKAKQYKSQENTKK